MKPDYNYTRLPLATLSMLTIPRNQTDPLLIALLTEDKEGGKACMLEERTTTCSSHRVDNSPVCACMHATLARAPSSCAMTSVV